MPMVLHGAREEDTYSALSLLEDVKVSPVLLHFDKHSERDFGNDYDIDDAEIWGYMKICGTVQDVLDLCITCGSAAMTSPFVHVLEKWPCERNPRGDGFSDQCGHKYVANHEFKQNGMLLAIDTARLKQHYSSFRQLLQTLQFWHNGHIGDQA